MKIVSVISSPSYDGNTAVLVRETMKAARESQATVEEIFLPNMDIRYCRGCFRCMAEGRCPIADDFESVRGKLLAADGLVFGSPTYGLYPNALMKNLFDRLGMFSVYTSAFADKYFVGISTAGGFGAKQVAKRLTQIVGGMFGSGTVSGTLGILRGWTRVEENPKALAQARGLGRKLVEDIRRGHRYPFQNLFDRLLTALVVRRVIKRNVLENRRSRMKAVYENLVSRDLIRRVDPP